MIKLSASSIKDYLSCPNKFYFRTVAQKGDEELAIQTPEMQAGTIVHKIIETCWNRELEGRKTGIRMSKDLPDNMKERVDRCLNNFYKMRVLELNKYDYIERRFSIPYSSPIEYRIVGMFDRVSLKNNCMWDWKTGEEYVKNIDNDIQFIIYYNSYVNLYGKKPDALFYVSLYYNRLIRFNYKKSLTDELYNEIIPSMLTSIKKELFYRKGIFDRANTCNYCSYKKICLGE